MDGAAAAAGPGCRGPRCFPSTPTHTLSPARPPPPTSLLPRTATTTPRSCRRRSAMAAAAGVRAAGRAGGLRRGRTDRASSQAGPKAQAGRRPRRGRREYPTSSTFCLSAAAACGPLPPAVALGRGRGGGGGGANQEGIGAEEDAVLGGDGPAELEGAEAVAADQAGRAEVGQVAAGVVDEVRADAQPQGPAPAVEEVVHDDGGLLPALAHAGAVAHEEAAAPAVGQAQLVLRDGAEAGLGLGGGEEPVEEDARREAQAGGDGRHRDGRQRRGLDELVGVREERRAGAGRRDVRGEGLLLRVGVGEPHVVVELALAQRRRALVVALLLARRPPPPPASALVFVVASLLFGSTPSSSALALDMAGCKGIRRRFLDVWNRRGAVGWHGVSFNDRRLHSPA